MEQKNPDIKINELVKSMLKDKHMTGVDLSNAMGWSYDAGYKLLKRSDWKISEMQGAGRLLNFNFFSLFVETHEPALREQLAARDKELAELKSKMAFMEQENKFMRELVEMAKLKLRK